MRVKYVREGEGTPRCCEVRVVQDPGELRAAMRSMGADPARDEGVKILLGRGLDAGRRGSSRRSTSIMRFDEACPSLSSSMIAMAVASMMRDASRDDCVGLRLDKVDAAHHERVLLTVVKSCYAPRRSTRAVLEFGGVVEGERLERVARAALLAADLENVPSNLSGPEALGEAFRAWFLPRNGSKKTRQHGLGAEPGRVQVQVLHAADLERLGMGLVLGVGRSGERPPCVTVLTLRSRIGAPSPRRTVALVGKGVTYDAGGLALKPLHAMLGMHGDKSGACVAAAVLWYYAQPGAPPLDFDLVAILPSVENVVSARSVHPGDVLTACDGTTVEVNNPDAEGRLVLADAFAHAARAIRPWALVDFATLTGFGGTVAPDVSAVFWTADDALAAAVHAAGEATGERCWRLPPWEDGIVGTASKRADVRNSGWDTEADAYMAAMFLKRFVPKSCGGRWVHVDISKNTAPGETSSGNAGDDVFVGVGVAVGIRLVASFLRKN